jgi:hypothetical protein
MEKVNQEIAAQAVALHQHEKQFTAMEVAFREASARHNQHLETLSGQLQQLMQASRPPAVSPPTAPGPEPPPKCSGALFWSSRYLPLFPDFVQVDF